MTQFDNQHVDHFEGKPTGKFQLDWRDAEDIEIGDVVTLVVSTVVSAVGHNTNKVGEIIRTNTFKVEECAVVPYSKVAALKSAIDDEYFGAQIEDASMFELDEGDLAGLDDEGLSV